MIMPERVRIAVDVIVYLRSLESEEPQRVEDLAEKLGTTKNFLHQVVGPLSKAGIISAIKGPRGGLTGNLNNTSLLDVYQLFGYLNGETLDDRASSRFEKSIKKFLSTIVL